MAQTAAVATVEAEAVRTVVLRVAAPMAMVVVAMAEEVADEERTAEGAVAAVEPMVAATVVEAMAEELWVAEALAAELWVAEARETEVKAELVALVARLVDRGIQGHEGKDARAE